MAKNLLSTIAHPSASARHQDEIVVFDTALLTKREHIEKAQQLDQLRAAMAEASEDYLQRKTVASMRRNKLHRIQRGINPLKS